MKFNMKHCTAGLERFGLSSYSLGLLWYAYKVRGLVMRTLCHYFHGKGSQTDAVEKRTKHVVLSSVCPPRPRPPLSTPLHLIQFHKYCGRFVSDVVIAAADSPSARSKHVPNSNSNPTDFPLIDPPKAQGGFKKTTSGERASAMPFLPSFCFWSFLVRSTFTATFGRDPLLRAFLC